MRNLLLRALISLLYLGCIPALSQEISVLRIGVAMVSLGTKDVPDGEARDRLVKALNQHKPDKQLRISIQAIALDALPGGKAILEGKEKKCQFVVYNRMKSLETKAQFQPSYSGTVVEDRPSSDATVEFVIQRVADGVTYAVGSAKSENQLSARDAVLQAIVRVGPKVIAALRKADAEGATARVQPGNVATPTASNPGEVYFRDDFCGWLPAEISHADALRGVCQYAISLPQKMPNFICQQETSRYSGNDRIPTELITAAVRYEDGSESYSEIKLNGRPAPSAIADSPGLWSTGEFGDALRAIFNQRNHASFAYQGEETIGQHRAWLFSYEIARQDEPSWRLHAEDQVVAPAYGGELWVNETSGEVLRFRSVAEAIPETFPLQAAERMTDYDNIRFADGTAFVLPVESSILSRLRGQEAMRNVVQFEGCHKFRAEARIVNMPGTTGPSAAQQGSPEAAKEAEQAEKIYAILREQALREDAAQLKIEQRQELEWTTIGAFWKLAGIERQKQKNREQQATLAGNTATGAGTEAVTTFKVSVRLVSVSAVPRDAAGHAVGDLKKENFELFDERKPQIITRFSVENAAGQKTPGGSGGVPASAAERGAGANPPIPERAVAYVFDDLHTSFADLASAVNAAAKHLEALPAQDRAAFFTTSGEIAVDFTADREKLRTALQTVKSQAEPVLLECPPMSYYVADLIVNQSDPSATALAIQDAAKCGPPQAEKARQLAEAKAYEVFSEGRAKSIRALSILEEVEQRTAAAPGRRSIVLVSPGFLTLDPDAQAKAMALIEGALKADIIVNALDVGGLRAQSMGDDSTHLLDEQEAFSRSAVMADLSYGTGGTFFKNNNDLEEGFRRTGDLPEYVYVLGFAPQKLDGRFHKLKVTVKGPNQVTVQARPGYYALKPDVVR